jgi:Skp family chaperone for outer membrane proteins
MRVTKLLFILCLIASGAVAQNIATIDYPVTFILHPLMSNYRFERGAFEKAPLLIGEKEYEAWLIKVGSEIKAMKTRHEKDLASARSKVERLQSALNRLAERNHSTINSLAVRFDQLRRSDKPEDKARLSRVDYGAQIREYEEKFQRESLEARQALDQAVLEYEKVEELIESPRYTTSEETQKQFALIQQEIVNAANYVMRSKNCSTVLNSAGMGWPAPNKPVHSLDPALLARSSDQEIELYKRLLVQSPEPPPQDAPNPEYREQLRNTFLRNRVGSIRRTVHARSALRLVEPDVVPRVLIGGISITIETVNYLLFQYKVSEANRGLIAQVLREMRIN